MNSRGNESIRENTTQNGNILRKGVNLYGVSPLSSLTRTVSVENVTRMEFGIPLLSIPKFAAHCHNLVSSIRTHILQQTYFIALLHPPPSDAYNSRDKNDDVKHNFSTLLARCYVVTIILQHLMTSFCNI